MAEPECERKPRGISVLVWGLGVLEILFCLGLVAWLLFPALFRMKTYRTKSAVEALKAIVTAEEQYKSMFGRYTTLAGLSAFGAGSDQGPLLDARLGSGRMSGYCFRLTLGNPWEYWRVTGDPISPRQAETRRFFVDSSAVIRFHRSHTASSADSPIE